MKETIVVRIKPPMTEHCRSCEYEDSVSFGIYRVVCPTCGQKTIENNARPMKEPVRVEVIENSHEKSVYFTGHSGLLPLTFHDMRLNKLTDSDYDSPLWVAKHIRDELSDYLVSSQLQDAIDLVEWLEEHKEDQEMLTVKRRHDELTRELYELVYQNPELVQE